MRVVFITDSYYPSPSPNAICVRNLKEVFDEKGISTDIVAIRTFPAKTKNQTDKSVHFINPDLLYSLLIEAKAKRNAKQIFILSTIFKIRGAINGFFWPLSSISHIIKYFWKVKTLLSKTNEDTIVIGVYKSLEAAVAGALLKKMNSNATFFLYTLDAISGSIIPSVCKSKIIPQKSIKRWEKFLFNSYDNLFLLQSHNTYYNRPEYELYRSKIHYVDIPLLKVREPMDMINDGKIHFVFTGSLSTKTANPQYFLRILDFLDNDKFIFDIYGHIYDKDIDNSIKCSRFANYHGVVAHDDILSIQSTSSILINFGNDTPCAIPCKIFEYFSTGKPVISFIKIDNDASLPYIHKYPSSLIIDERKSIQENANNTLKFIKEITYTNSGKIECMFKENLPGYTVEQIIELGKQHFVQV